MVELITGGTGPEGPRRASQFCCGRPTDADAKLQGMKALKLGWEWQEGVYARGEHPDANYNHGRVFVIDDDELLFAEHIGISIEGAWPDFRDTLTGASLIPWMERVLAGSPLSLVEIKHARAGWPWEVLVTLDDYWSGNVSGGARLRASADSLAEACIEIVGRALAIKAAFKGAE